MLKHTYKYDVSIVRRAMYPSYIDRELRWIHRILQWIHRKLRWIHRTTMDTSLHIAKFAKSCKQINKTSHYEAYRLHRKKYDGFNSYDGKKYIALA